MKNIKWYINRLSKMPIVELVYRLQHKLRVNCDEFFLSGMSLPLSVDGQFELSEFDKFAEHIERKCLSEIWNKEQINTLLINAEHNLGNRFSIFGKRYSFGPYVNWHLEPKANKQWPKFYWNKMNIRDGFSCGAPKFVWELNRLYSLPILGLAFKETQKRKYADKIFYLVGSWVEANPYPYGVNWTSGIEIAVRTANLIWALVFINGYELTSIDRKNLNTFFYYHARHLFRYPSKYSSNNNHAIAEAFGLFLIGVFFPFYAKAEKWRQYGQTVLERECLRQILPDGGSCERSTTYLSFVFDFFLLFKLVCDMQGIKYNPELDKRLEKSCKFIFSLMDSHGNIPNIGDQDSAVLVNFGLDNHENFQSILNTGYVLFGKDEFVRDSFPDIKTRILLDDRAHKRKSSRKNSSSEQPRAELLSESGLGVVRAQVHDKEILLVGNATPLGMPPLYGHGHLDALSIYLSIGGREILVDPGTYLYHSGGKWRRYFRSTAAHNTIRVDKQDMAEQISDFMFGRPYKITGHSIEDNGNVILWKAKHDAYLNQNASVVHERKVKFNTSEGSFEIKDLLDGQKNCFVEQFFHFHPQCIIELDENKAVVKCDDISLIFIFDAELKVAKYRGSEAPLSGWFSKRFNHIEPCWTLVGQTEITGKQELTTNIILQS